MPWVGLFSAGAIIKALAYGLIAFLIIVVLPTSWKNDGVREAQRDMLVQQQAYKKRVDDLTRRQIEASQSARREAHRELQAEIDAAYELYLQMESDRAKHSLPDSG